MQGRENRSRGCVANPVLKDRRGVKIDYAAPRDGVSLTVQGLAVFQDVCKERAQKLDVDTGALGDVHEKVLRDVRVFALRVQLRDLVVEALHVLNSRLQTGERVWVHQMQEDRVLQCRSYECLSVSANSRPE